MTHPETEVPRATVIIPNWNGAEHLPECLESLKSQTFGPFEVLVVDNGSNDDSLELLGRRYPSVRVLELGKNTGFSGAVNAGIRATSAEYVILLNNDTRAEPEWLERMIKAMDEELRASFGACKMLRHDPPHLIDAAGDRYSLWHGSAANIGAGRPADQHRHPGWVFGACAGAAIYRRALFDDIGVFDEEFFLIFEDVDFDLRAQVSGHRCLYIPDAVVYHKRGASTDSLSPEVISRAFRNHIWVAGKNLPPALFAVWLSWLPARLLFRMAYSRLLIVTWPLFRHFGWSAAAPVRRTTGKNWHLEALRQGLSALPRKRRMQRDLRRLGSLALLPVLICPFRRLR